MNKTIMIIEDDYETQLIFAEFLRSEGFDVAAVSHGKEALEYLNDHPLPNLIIMDLTLPHMSAEDFVSELRKGDARSTIPLMIVSGKAEIAEYKEKLGAQTYVKKPFDMDHMLKTINTFF